MEFFKYSEIASKIKARRKALGYSFQDLANKTGMSKSTLQRYETGSIKNIPITRLKILSDALEYDVDDLIGIQKQLEQSISLTEHEQKLIRAYRNNPAMQTAVDKLLGLEAETNTYKIAARDGQKEVGLSREQREEMAKSVERAKGDDISDLV